MNPPASAATPARPRRGVRRLLPRSLAGQTILLVLLAIFFAQAISLWVVSDDNRVMKEALRREVLLDRAAAAARTLIATPDPQVRSDLLAAMSDRRLTFDLSDRPLPTMDGDAMNAFDRQIANKISQALAETGVRRVLAHGKELQHFWRKKWFDPKRAGHHRDDKDVFEADQPPRRFRLAMSIELPDGQWLNIASNLLTAPPPRPLPILLFYLVVTLTLSTIIVLMIRRITRPLARLSQAAEALGRGQQPPDLDEHRGPEELRRTTRAFKDMQARLQRFVQDRTAMLAAVSHDLRTPITSLRLRAEFIEDEEVRAKVLETLAEMQQMVEASLDFLREESQREDGQKLDLDALTQALVDDLSDMGRAITFQSHGPVLVACQPLALKRALRNLMNNACFYGERAQVHLQEDSDSVAVVIEDQGPGIPEDQLDEVFRPFFRLDRSRNRETGGIGLGLAIAAGGCAPGSPCRKAFKAKPPPGDA